MGRYQKKNKQAGRASIAYIVVFLLIVMLLQIFRLHQKDQEYIAREAELTVQLEEETVITYASQGKIRLNSYYKPYKYEIEHTRTGSYPIDYKVNLNEATPYMLESKGMEQGSTENLYCAFSSSKEPINIIEQQQKEYEDTEKRNKIIVTVCGIVGGIAFIVLVISIIQLILTKKRAPKR